MASLGTPPSVAFQRLPKCNELEPAFAEPSADTEAMADESARQAPGWRPAKREKMILIFNLAMVCIGLQYLNTLSKLCLGVT